MELLEETSRWFFNCDHHFFDDNGNGEISMKMIVTTKEAFELKYKREKQCLLRSPSVLLYPLPDPHPRSPSCGLQCSRFVSNSITMMGMLNYYGDADNDDSELILKMMMNTNGN